MVSRFIRGFIDGSLSTLGIVVGASSASVSIVIAAAVGGTFANGFSNFLSAFAAAGMEEFEDLRQIEKAMVSKDFKQSDRYHKAGRKTAAAGAIDGLATIAGGAIPIIPYFFTAANTATILAVVLVIGSVFIVGLYLGKLSAQNVLLSAVKMAVFASAIAVAVYFIQIIIVPE
jgi:predicted membrane protein (TIGR00267 family)